MTAMLQLIKGDFDVALYSLKWNIRSLSRDCTVLDQF
jgi:hypothetical protein